MLIAKKKKLETILKSRTKPSPHYPTFGRTNFPS